MDQVNERRYANTLRLTAGGTLCMGIWSFLKTFLTILGDMKDELTSDEIPYAIAVFGVAIVFFVIFIIGISFRYIVWKGARKEAAKGDQGNGYVACAIVLMAYGFYSIGSFICMVIRNEADGYDVTKMILDVTSFVILCELLYSVFKLRKIRRTL